MLIKVGDEVLAKEELDLEYQCVYKVKHIINPDTEEATLVCTYCTGDSYYFKLDEVELYKSVHSEAVFTNSEQPESVNTGDAINPLHYQHGNIETIDYMEAIATKEEYEGHLRLTAVKYLSRFGKKGSKLEQAEKAAWYVNKLIESLKGE